MICRVVLLLLLQVFLAYLHYPSYGYVFRLHLLDSFQYSRQNQAWNTYFSLAWKSLPLVLLERNFPTLFLSLLEHRWWQLWPPLMICDCSNVVNMHTPTIVVAHVEMSLSQAENIKIQESGCFNRREKSKQTMIVYVSQVAKSLPAFAPRTNIWVGILFIASIPRWLS